MSLPKYLISLNIGILAFLAGYSFCRFIHSGCREDKRYLVVRENEQPFLLDQTANKKLILLENPLQLGTLEYRVTNLLSEPNLANVLKQIEDK